MDNQRGDYVYFEEDDDLGHYYKACVEAGYEIEWNYNHTNKSSKILSYASYRK